MNEFEKNYTLIDYKMVGERIKSLRGLKSQEEFAKYFDVSQVDISRFERGEVKPTTEFLYNLCIKFSKSFIWLLTGEESGIVQEPTIPYESEFITIPQVSGKIGAGEGLIPETSLEMKIAFRRDWIIREGNPEKMLLIRIKGDSMEPTLFDGDLILVDHNRNYVEPPGGIYAIFMNDVIVVKRIQVIPSGNLKVISDNPKYESMNVDLDQIKINGKVIWFGRELER